MPSSTGSVSDIFYAGFQMRVLLGHFLSKNVSEPLKALHPSLEAGIAFGCNLDKFSGVNVGIPSVLNVADHVQWHGKLICERGRRNP